MNRTMWAFALTLTLASCAQGDDAVETAAKPGGDRSAKAVSVQAGVPGPNNTVSSDGESGDAEAEFKEAMALSAYSRVEYRDVQGETISFEEFKKQMSGGKSFGTIKNPNTKVALVSLNAPGKTSAVAKDHIRLGSRMPVLKKATTIDGKQVDDGIFSGRYTLVNFFFSECVPCIAEVPTLNAYAKAHPEIGVLAVTFDDARDAGVFADKRKFDWPILAESEKYIDAVGVKTYPTTLLIGPDRKIAAKMTTELLQKQPDTASAVAALERWVNSQK